MKPVLALSYLALGAALLPAASFAGDPPDATSQTTTTVTSSTTATSTSPIASQIRSEMAAEHVASMTGISVDVDPSGVVSLTGSALSQDDVDKVVSISHNTAGVTAVNNNVTVKGN